MSDTSGEQAPVALQRGRHKKQFLYQQLAIILREQISAGVFTPGERIPSMDALTERYHVNKVTVRSALAELSAEGLIHSVPAQGTFVSDPSAQAPSSARRPVLTIGIVSAVMYPYLAGHYHMEIQEAIRHELVTLQANLIMLPSHNMPTADDLLQAVYRANPDAVIYIGPFDNAALRRLARGPVPSVLLDYSVPALGMDTITIDNQGGGYQAMSHLIELGHRRLAVITGHPGQTAARERLSGAQTALADAGLPAEALTIINGDFQTPSGYRAMKELLTHDPVPTAVFAMNDEMAAGALQAIREDARFTVPDDISLIGFDDVSLALAMTPQLTTVRAPTRPLGTQAIQLLQQRIANPERETVCMTLGTTLVTRASTAPLAQA
jgi:LacI family transcriptional regulator